MEKTVGILYSSVDGQTLKICKEIVTHIENAGFKTELFDINDFNSSISKYSIFVIGASIRYGKHNKKVTEFIETHKNELENTNSAFFSVNLVARKPEKSHYNTNPYVIKFFNATTWQPKLIDVFAGRLDYQSYSFVDRMLIKMIMKMTNGPTKTNQPIEFTDWNRVKAFSQKILTT